MEEKAALRLAVVAQSLSVSPHLGVGGTDRVLLVILGGCWGRGPPQGLQHGGVASHGGLAMLHDGCATAMYARPLSSHSLEEDSLVSFIYINLTPLRYPAIYTLQNRDVQGALQRVVGPRTPGAVHQADVTKCWMPGNRNTKVQEQIYCGWKHQLDPTPISPE
ncbi:hypothetical protein E2I00_017548 [Balaenoptera physalus]|uniref:G-protein coupled receptors family 1 profile domain-containing protein n=1 Tax=Balaenoptera physalus TaxID=9770 RepID=A0A643BKS8_BALPH|nr:hypothetical protein E2I00_017548 [Balaenoptera physalus]